jgi:hypothetical protein
MFIPWWGLVIIGGAFIWLFAALEGAESEKSELKERVEELEREKKPHRYYDDDFP